MIKPRQPAPSLELKLANGTKWIKGLAELCTEFEKRCVWTVAASTDSLERA